MKLALICTEKLPSPAIKGGAIQIMIDGVAPILSKKHQLTVYSITDPKLAKRGKRGGISYIRFPSGSYVRNIAKSLAAEKFDVVHIFNRPKSAILLKKAAPQSRFVVSLHNEMFAPKKITHAQGMKVLASVDRIMTVSNFMGRTVTKRFTKAKSLMKTVYSGFNINTYIPSWTPEGQSIREKLRKKYGIGGKKVILFVGRLSDKKGPDVLIRSMKQILMRHKDAVLVIVGGRWFSDNTVDDYVRSLYKLARPYGKKIIFTKYIPNDQMPHHYLMADVFVCSSQWQEPLARVHYEAMGAGLPIITTNRGGNPEVIKHRNNGLVVKNYTKPSAFAVDINYMLSNPAEAMRMAKNGRNFVKGNFTFEHVAKRLNAVYTKAYQKRAKPTSERLKGATST